jgi:predicted acylesterase/phospholipase RssA
VRGLAYAGVLSKLPEEYRIMGLGGSSAGAIVAALIAIGNNPRELRKILADPQLYTLVSDGDSQRTKRIVAAAQDIRNFLQPPPSTQPFPDFAGN